MKTKEELKELKEELETLNKKLTELNEDELKEVVGGFVEEVDGDVASLRFSGKSVPLPPALSKKPIDGGKSGKVVTPNTPPNNVK